MEEKWIVYSNHSNVDELAAKLCVDPVLVKVMQNRGVTTLEDMSVYLGRTAGVKHDSKLLTDIDKASELLKNALETGAHIRIISDYDVDGITSNYVLLKGLQRVQAQVDAQKTAVIDYRIPHRMKDGYGMNPNMVHEAHRAGVTVLITCDNGIAAFDAISVAKEYGMTVIVTDHHEVQERLPEADAIVDPKREDCAYPFSDICGAVVAFKVLGRLYEDCAVAATELNCFLPYIAMATVCDVMPLIDENHNIAKYGIAYIRNHLLKGDLDTGLRALIDANELSAEKINSGSFGFTLGPCLNATGRLYTAELALKLLLDNNERRARRRANKLTMLNAIRKKMCARWERVAYQLVEQAPHCDRKVLVLYLSECHESIAGIVAGRVREYTGKPTLVLTKSRTAGQIKGSGRSVEAYNMFEKFSEWDRFVAFGGHSMAVGLSLQAADLEAFYTFVNENCGLSEEDICLQRKVDMILPISYWTKEIVNQIQYMDPCGRGNESPVFLQEGLLLKSIVLCGKNNNVLRLTFSTDQGESFVGVAFSGTPLHFLREVAAAFSGDLQASLDGRHSIDIPVKVLYRPQWNDYGMGSVEMRVISIKCAENH